MENHWGTNSCRKVLLIQRITLLSSPYCMCAHESCDEDWVISGCWYLEQVLGHTCRLHTSEGNLLHHLYHGWWLVRSSGWNPATLAPSLVSHQELLVLQNGARSTAGDISRHYEPGSDSASAAALFSDGAGVLCHNAGHYPIHCYFYGLCICRLPLSGKNG